MPPYEKPGINVQRLRQSGFVFLYNGMHVMTPSMEYVYWLSIK